MLKDPSRVQGATSISDAFISSVIFDQVYVLISVLEHMAELFTSYTSSSAEKHMADCFISIVFDNFTSASLSAQECTIMVSKKNFIMGQLQLILSFFHPLPSFYCHYSCLPRHNQ